MPWPSLEFKFALETLRWDNLVNRFARLTSGGPTPPPVVLQTRRKQPAVSEAEERDNRNTASLLQAMDGMNREEREAYLQERLRQCCNVVARRGATLAAAAAKREAR